MLGWQAAYAKALSNEKNGKWEAAIRVYSSLLERGEDRNAKVLFRLGHALFRRDRLEEATPYLERAVALEPTNASWHYRLAFVYERRKDFGKAIEHYDAALAIDPSQTKWQERRRKSTVQADVNQRAVHASELNDVMRSSGPAWERLDRLEAGYASHKSDKNWLKNLAAARFNMMRYEEAAQLYTEVVALDPKDADAQFMRGWSWQSCGRPVIAERCFTRAAELDHRLDAGILGVGVFYQGRGQWRLAAEAYLAELRISPENAELSFRAGMALQKVYAWKESLKYLTRAISLNPSAPHWHYRLGLSHERLGDMSSAAASYAEAVATSQGQNPYWSYRLGEVRAASNDFEASCDAYKDSFSSEDSGVLTPIDPSDGRQGYTEDLLTQSLVEALTSQSGRLCYALGRKAETLGMLSTAETAYRAAAARLEEHDPMVHYRLGRVLAAQGKWQEGTRAYSNVRIFKRPFGIDVAPYIKSPSARKSMVYLEYVETTEIENKVVLYESSHGASVSCNPLALYRHIVKDSRFEGYTHVWVLNDKRKIPAELRAKEDVIFVSRESDLYLRYLASAKYLINNNTFPPYFIRRDGQYYLNTWHGTPIKTLGRDIKSGMMDHKNAARNFLHTTHMIFPNHFTANCLMEKYDVADLFTGKAAITGYPRNDVLATTEEDRSAQLRRRLGIPFGKKVVLYAPTWRGTLASKVVDEERLTKDLESFGNGEWHFLYRGHSVTENNVSGVSTDIYSVPADIDTNDLLSIVDVLVTDYSSIMFDFLVTGRPVVYYAYDLESYQAERGLYFDLNEMGGAVCDTLDSAIEAVNSALDGMQSAECTPFVRELVQLEHGVSTKRVADFFFFGDDSQAMEVSKNDRPNALFYAGSFIPNGVTASYLNLVNRLPSDKWNLHTVVDPVAVASEAGRQEKFASNPAHVRAIGRVGIHLVSPEERWVVDKFNTQHNLDNEEMWDIYHRAHQREFLRIFGRAKFEAIICFEGYARFWASILAAPNTAPRVSSIYLHSVMDREWRNRFPYLEGVFRLYNRYDRLLSVSESASKANEQSLASRFGLTPEAFEHVDNLLNPAEVLGSAAAPLDADLDEWMVSEHKNFVTVGRLSPEKGHLKLIEAFAAVAAKRADARLVIVGDGPMRQRIMDLIDELSLGEKIFMAGMRMNPYPIVEKSDYFVFASDYEGQGIAVLEALILGKAVISTDVIGPQSILKGGFGRLVENSVSGLAGGMLDLMRNDPDYPRFDYETYLKDGLSRFTELALGEMNR